jgi:hypothetical protein
MSKKEETFEELTARLARAKVREDADNREFIELRRKRLDEELKKARKNK